MKIVVVTGASESVGYEVVKALLQSDESYRIFLGSRSLERGQQAVLTLRNECADSLGPRDKGCALKECPNCFNTVEAIQVDIASDLSIENAFETVKASVRARRRVIKDLDYVRGKASLRESFTGCYDVNVAGTHVMTWTFMPLLLQSYDPRLIFVTGLDTFEESAREDFPLPLQERGWPKTVELATVGYRCTKTALNMLMLDYHHKLQVDGVKVWCVGPGFLATDLRRYLPKTHREAINPPFALKPEDLQAPIPRTGLPRPDVFAAWLARPTGGTTPVVATTVVELWRSHLMYPVYSDSTAFVHEFGGILKFRPDVHELATRTFRGLRATHDLVHNGASLITKNAFFGAHFARRRQRTGWTRPTQRSRNTT
ncbi:hypothetical protein VE04_03736 [Pseudogymnoascus sp. 24MN13]|nr:hypothetical protein VE04_03736 [Pseudogymnoascus sp. 24MN13]